MPVAMFLEPVVTEQSVGVQDTARRDCALDEGLETVGRGVGDPAHPDTADSRTDLLGRDGNQGFLLGLPTPDALLGCTEVGFVDFDRTRESVPPRAHHRSTQLVQPGPCCFVAPQPQDTLEAHCARARLLAGDPPHGAEPCAQRGPGILKDRASGDRGLPAAARALEQRRPHEPRLPLPARRAAEPVRPAQLNETRPTRVLGPEAGLEVGERPRIVFHKPEHYRLWLPESKGYPL